MAAPRFPAECELLRPGRLCGHKLMERDGRQSPCALETGRDADCPLSGKPEITGDSQAVSGSAEGRS